eukprot:CAMPEP_0168550276 /NCGR_PEP_ID=MMETSP0413-20121227/5550_1 /TAXON_ID=136452 /ORGANISM="Filamoeba nolandi, Strain NC-AS-23-1" /LENGTH=465 /DNA_ID=CAMNT_0008580719 /DNA_START=277 /DNA_END=1674 /DNA_ORIENTATION=+
MDTWNDKQLAKMQAGGGNANLSSFFNEYGVDNRAPIKEKYHSKAAEVYRNKVSAKAEGKSFKMPSPDDVKSGAAFKSSPQLSTSHSSKSSSSKSSLSSSTGSNQKDDDEWDWDDKPKKTKSASSSNMSYSPTPSQYGGYQNTGSSSSSSSSYQSNSSSQSYSSNNSPKQRVPDFSNVTPGPPPPAGKSKYSGKSISSDDYFRDKDPNYQPNNAYGSSSSSDEYYKMLEDGWSKLSIFAKSAATVATETAKVAAEKVKQTSTDLSSKDWSTQLSGWSETGWNTMSTVIQKAKEYVPAEFATTENSQQPDPNDPHSGFMSYQQISQTQPSQGRSMKPSESESAEALFGGTSSGNRNSGSFKPSQQEQDNFDAWLSEQDSGKSKPKKPSSSKKTKAQSSNGWDDWEENGSESSSKSAPQQNSDWDQWDVDSTQPTESPKTSQKGSKNGSKKQAQKGKEGWDNWDNEDW